jgi:hypothetical protein
MRQPFPHIEKIIVSPQDVDYSVTRSPEKRTDAQTTLGCKK